MYFPDVDRIPHPLPGSVSSPDMHRQSPGRLDSPEVRFSRQAPEAPTSANFDPVLSPHAATLPQVIDLMGEARISSRFSLTLCEKLLLKAIRASQKSPRAAGHADEARYRELLLTYVRLHSSHVHQQLALVRSEVLQVEERTQSLSGSRATHVSSSSSTDRVSRSTGEQWHFKQQLAQLQRAIGFGRSQPLRLAASAAFAVGSLVRGDHLLLRLCRAMPLLFLMQQPGRRRSRSGRASSQDS